MTPIFVKNAGDKILEEANNVQKESEIESIAQSKGYSEICVYVDGSEANIMVRKDGFSDEDVVKTYVNRNRTT